MYIDTMNNTERPEYHFYGMRLRGYSLGAQPEGCVKSMVDQRGRYYDILVYPRLLTEDELRDYELDFLS